MNEFIGPLELGPIAHGGHVVARHEGRVVFVRGGLPGETAIVELTDTRHDRYWNGRVRRVLEASPDRVEPELAPAAYAGTDFAFATLAAQRRLKAQVVTEQLARLGGVDAEVRVEAVSGDREGWGWRTRMRYLHEDGRVGLRGYHTDELVEPPAGTGFLLADPRGPAPHDLARHAARAGREITVTVADSGVTVTSDGRVLSGEPVVTQQVRGMDFRVRADGFWQVHPGAAEALTDAVLNALRVREGERVLDLYCGVGLFAGALARAGARVTGMEANQTAVRLARANVPQARFLASRLERGLTRLGTRADAVVLDPPRSGAGKRVIDAVTGLGARAIVYVACDPAALGRDVAGLRARGYELTGVRAFDIFPMTHHVETVVLLTRGQG
ncbi:RNA methyltransferase trmA family signature 2 [Propionibacterium ruminifibrarum]|uniref:RNA methyltransferase trmA family signature 2 n=1 Tax=Propionibacterium ruminifibrarum TaxID=1962131 RepID=A0A375I0M2_9ACTN|nr:methyltransferase [Propionibacterium ruminifibrarum]SPF67617.1 RNA methyltransferase trmA family signature 2 [Propionibacterium ruminifibrarum]